MIGGCAGVSLGGWLADRLGARDARWYLRMPAIVSVSMTPFAVGFLFADEPRTALVLLAVAYTLMNMYVGPLWSTVQNLARPDMRAMASAVLLLVLNIVGLGMGPLLVGMLNDAFAGRFGDEAVRWSLLVVTCLGGLGGILFWVGSESLPEELAARDA
jgi:MFS family permease